MHNHRRGFRVLTVSAGLIMGSMALGASTADAGDTRYCTNKYTYYCRNTSNS